MSKRPFPAGWCGRRGRAPSTPRGCGSDERPPQSSVPPWGDCPLGPSPATSASAAGCRLAPLSTVGPQMPARSGGVGGLLEGAEPGEQAPRQGLAVTVHLSGWLSFSTELASRVDGLTTSHTFPTRLRECPSGPVTILSLRGDAPETRLLPLTAGVALGTRKVHSSRTSRQSRGRPSLFLTPLRALGSLRMSPSCLMDIVLRFQGVGGLPRGLPAPC